MTAATALKPTFDDHTWIALAAVNTHPRRAIATRLSHLFLPPPPRRILEIIPPRGTRVHPPLPPFLSLSTGEKKITRGGEGSPEITRSMGAVVVVDLWDNTRGETRSFVDLLDGVHATTSNAHGPAAFSPRLRCRLAVAARNESAAWRLPLVRACALALRVTRRGRVTRRPLLLDALENRLALLGAGGTGRVCAGIASLSLFPVVVGSAATQQPSHDAIRSLRAS